MRKFEMSVNNISKQFGRRLLFENVSFVVNEHQSFAIIGKNGSGKSTLIKILCGLLAPTKGQISYRIDEQKKNLDDLYMDIGLVSPYLNMYDEFSGEENLQLFLKIRGLKPNQVAINELMGVFNIYDHRKKEVRYYSSGMKQRLKYCAALLHKPVVLFLDEPTANLDESGISIVRQVMQGQMEKGSIICATNEIQDLKYADTIINIDELNKG